MNKVQEKLLMKIRHIKIIALIAKIRLMQYKPKINRKMIQKIKMKIKK